MTDVIYDWSLIGLGLAIAVVFLIRHIRRRPEIRADRRRDAGLCPKCGYDLCGSPDRCPECGLAIEKEMPEND